MSRAPTPTNFAKVKIWGETGTRMETEGGSLGVINLMFCTLTVERQAKLLAKMQASHAERAAKETAPLNSGDLMDAVCRDGAGS